LLIGPDEVAPTWIVGTASFLASLSPEEAFFWHRLAWVVPERGRKTVVMWWCCRNKCKQKIRQWELHAIAP